MTALEALATVDDVTVTGSGIEADPWVVEFGGDHEGQNVDQLSSDISALTGTSDPTISITTTQNGAGGDAFLWSVRCHGRHGDHNHVFSCATGCRRIYVDDQCCAVSNRPLGKGVRSQSRRR